MSTTNCIKYLPLALQPIGSKGQDLAEPVSREVPASRVAGPGSDVYCRNLRTYDCLAIRLVVAHRPPHSALPPDDSECLCDAGGLSIVC
jgi:hypothetical protein